MAGQITSGEVTQASQRLGVVAIGRNEGERLARCLTSLQGRAAVVVYVDSGSTDSSIERARALGASTVLLPADVPFTAARARNAGFRRLLELMPHCELVQFVDGDCEVVAGWLERAAAHLDEAPQCGVVCGRRRERHPEASVYNRLCDLEWDTPVGEALACGGDALMRVAAVREVGGYDDTLIAGEEPELCLRLRRRGWRIERIDAEMTLHDAAMTHFSQWWLRSVRAGHAFAEGTARWGKAPERHWRRETRSNWLWGLGVPAAALLLAPPTVGLSLGLLGGYVALGLKIYRYQRRAGLSAEDARLYAAFCVLSKFPQVQGQLTYWQKRWRGTPSRIIEYKTVETSSSTPA